MKYPTVVILLDALGYSVTERFGFSPGGLPHTIRMRTVPGFSQPALTSIFTGLPPDRHELWMMYSFSKDRSPFRWLSIIPENVPENRLWLKRLIDWKLRSIDNVKSYYSLYNIPRNVLRYLDLPAKGNLFVPGGVERVNTVIDELAQRGSRIFVRDYHTPEVSAFEQLEEALVKEEADFYLLYTAELDADLHKYGTRHENIDAHLKWYSERLEALLSINKNIRLLVFGDHGMCQVSDTIDIKDKIESLGLRIPEDYIPFYDSTLARFKVYSKKAEREITDILSDLQSGTILDDIEKQKLGIYFADNEYGDIIFLLNAGKIILPSYMSESPVAGMHGYHPDNECMYSSMFSNVDFKVSDGSIMDIADFILPGFISGKR
ncbi:MAG TPA: alkaline phosphatase family protein [Candidatus Krumholzibacteriaceae bacterium]|nr:alkaline phosphatase family protein [Candidatus Krumholzibacteriaceae bacterium]